MRLTFLIPPPEGGRSVRQRVRAKRGPMTGSANRVGVFFGVTPPRFASLTRCKATLPFRGRDKKAGGIA